MESNCKKKFLLVIGGVAVLAAGAVGSAALLSRPALKLKTTSTVATEKTIKVKGVAEKEIVSDLGALTVEIKCTSSEIPSGYAELNRINNLLLQKMQELGIKEDSIQSPSIRYNSVFKDIAAKDGNKVVTRSVFSHYLFTRSYRIVTADVQAIQNASLKLYDLVSAGVNIEVYDVQYFIDNPEQYKLELVDEASKSAYQRARIVADTCGSQLGALLVARQGVIQINKPASNETSDYGTYDTSSIKKVMRLVVTLEFALK